MSKFQEQNLILTEPDMADIDAVEHLIRDNAAQAQGFGIDEFKPDGHFNHRLIHDPKVLLVKDTAGNFLGATIYGYSNLSRIPGSIFSAYFTVKKEHQRKGIATLLLNAVSDISDSIGCDTLVFDVYMNNYSAMGLLYKAGFYCIGSLRYCGYVKGKGFTDCLLFHRKSTVNAIDNVVSKL